MYVGDGARFNASINVCVLIVFFAGPFGICKTSSSPGGRGEEIQAIKTCELQYKSHQYTHASACASPSRVDVDEQCHHST